MITKRFQRTKEDFECEKCGFFVNGNGYTNHCPKCLWSKHVDINPGDRKEVCGGMMEPIKIENKKSESIILHKCIKCNFERRNRVLKEDDFNKVIEISRHIV